MSRLSSYEIWGNVKKRIETQIGSQKDLLKSYEEKWTNNHNRIHEIQIELDLLENNLQIAKGRLLALPKPEQTEQLKCLEEE